MPTPSVTSGNHGQYCCRSALSGSSDKSPAEAGFLVERLADDLQAERQALSRRGPRHRDARQAGEVRGHREDVVEVHRDRIIGLLADNQTRLTARSGVSSTSHFLKASSKSWKRSACAPSARADSRRRSSRRQHVGADQDGGAALPCRSPWRACSRRSTSVLARPDARAVAHAVIAREVRRRFGRRHDVIGRQRILRVRQRDVDDDRRRHPSAIRCPAARASRSPPACRRRGIPSACRSSCP
jgi:hypothetical protein